MEFGLDIFHESATSRQAHLRLSQGDAEDHAFALFHLHAPPTTPAYGTLHLVGSDFDLESQLEDVMSGLCAIAADEMEFDVQSFLVTQSVDLKTPVTEFPEFAFAIERHRPSGNSTCDLILDDRDDSKDQRRVIAVFERFTEADGSMNVLTIVGQRFHGDACVDPLMAIIDANIGTPAGSGNHQLDVIFANLVGQYGAGA